MPLDQFLDYADKTVIGRAPGMGVWLTKVEHGASPMLLRHVEHNRVLHETVVLMTFVIENRPRVPFHERHSLQRLGHGFYRIQIRLGFMQTPDIPLTLSNCRMLGFDADLDHRNYYLAHETIVRRAKGSAMGPVLVRDLLVSQPDRQPRAGLFQNPARRHHRSRIPRRDLSAGTLRLIFRLEIHRHAVDAIAQMRRRRTVVEHMAEMAAAAAAMHLGAGHE